MRTVGLQSMRASFFRSALSFGLTLAALSGAVWAQGISFDTSRTTGGSIRPGFSTVCDSASIGAIRSNGAATESCNGTSWVTLSGGGGGGTTFSCPAGFTMITSASQVLGCINTANQTADTCLNAHNQCLQSFGARLTTFAELRAGVSLGLVPTDTNYWTSEASAGGCGFMNLTNPGSASISNNYVYRCFIPPVGTISQTVATDRITSGTTSVVTGASSVAVNVAGSNVANFGSAGLGLNTLSAVQVSSTNISVTNLTVNGQPVTGGGSADRITSGTTSVVAGANSVSVTVGGSNVANFGSGGLGLNTLSAVMVSSSNVSATNLTINGLGAIQGGLNRTVTSGAACTRPGELARTSSGELVVCEGSALEGSSCSGFNVGAVAIGSDGRTYYCSL